MLVALTALLACSKEAQEAEESLQPDITLTSPAPASFHAEGEIAAEGTFQNLRSVTVDGHEASPSQDNTFSGTTTLVRGLNVVEAYGSRPDGEYRYARNGVLAGDFQDSAGPLNEAAALRVNRDGIDAALDFVGGMIDQETVAAAALGMNPVYQDSYGVWGWDAVEITANVDDITFDTPILQAEPRAGELDLYVTIPNLFVDLQAVGDVVGIDFDVDASVSAEQANIQGTLTLDVTRDGSLDIALVDADVDLSGFAYDTSLLPGDVEAYLFVDTIRGKLEDMLLEQIETIVPPLLEDTLGGLDLSFSLDLLGTTVRIAASFAEAGIDAAGIYLVSDIAIDVPVATGQDAPGFLAAPSFTAEPDKSSAVSALISDDLLNKLFFDLWRGGLLNLRLSTDDGSLEPLYLLALKAEQGTIAVQGKLPPVAMHTERGLELQVGELEVTIDTPGGELGEHLIVAVNVSVPLDLGYSEGQVVLELGSPELVMMVRESDWGAEEETVTALLEELLPIHTILALLGDIAFDVPSLDGLEIRSAEVQRDGSKLATHVLVELD